MKDCERVGVETPPELRTSDDGSPSTVRGIASVYNQETRIGGLFGFREQIAPGAFDSALARPDDVRALFNHDSNSVLGRTKNGTLKLRSTPEGLAYEVELPNTGAARDVEALLKRGDVTGSSFGFKVLDEQWDESRVKDGELPLRTITDVELFDVSPVTFPAYPQTSAEARSRAELCAAAPRTPAEIREDFKRRIAEARAWDHERTAVA